MTLSYRHKQRLLITSCDHPNIAEKTITLLDMSSLHEDSGENFIIPLSELTFELISTCEQLISVL